MNDSHERHLYYSDKSNEPIDNLRFNKHILSIRLGKKFNHPVNELPRALTLRGCFAIRLI